MFLPNLVRALTKIRGLLVPGGRCAAAVWGPPEKVPFTSVPMSAIRRVLQLSLPPAGTPGTFSLADEQMLERSFSQAGFAGVAIERHTFTLEYRSIEEFVEERPATSASLRTMLSEASPIQRRTIWQTVSQEMSKYADANGVLRVPTESLCVVGRA